MNNYFAAETAIQIRLKEKVTELQAVYTAVELDDIPTSQQKFPCAHVLYNGDRVATKDDGRSSSRELQLVDQEWYVVVAVRNVRDQITGTAARADAGPIIMKVLKALQGWQPTFEHGQLTRVNGARAGYKAGHLYVPLLFTTRITV